MIKKIFIILLISFFLFGCTQIQESQETENNTSQNNTEFIQSPNNETITTPLDQRTPSFSCVNKDVLGNTWHCVQIYQDTPKETADWWQERCSLATRSLSDSPCEIKDYVCMTPNNWTAEFYYNTPHSEVDDSIKNRCEKV